MQQEQKFKEWLIQQGYKEQGAATSYPRAIPLISQHYTDKTGILTDIYSIIDPNKINQLVSDYSSQGRFSEFGHEQHGRFRAAIKKYVEFFTAKHSSPEPMPIPPRPPPKPRLIYKNKISEHEKNICSILASIAYHVHPKITQLIVEKNIEEYDKFKELFADKIEINNYLFNGSACVFPGIRRYVSGKGARRKYNPSEKAIIDDNHFPRHIWCFLTSGKLYSGPYWKTSGLGEFELAHIFTHKKTETELENTFFGEIEDNTIPHGHFSCACNVVLLPKGTVRPTDNSKTIKSVFYKRYIELYGEKSIHGRHKFHESKIPDWYKELQWNDPPCPDDWESKTNKLIEYRTEKVTQILNKQ